MGRTGSLGTTLGLVTVAMLAVKPVQAEPRLVARGPLPGRASDVLVAGNRALVVGTVASAKDEKGRKGFLLVLDVSDPKQPTVVRGHALDIAGKAVQTREETAYVVGDAEGGLLSDLGMFQAGALVAIGLQGAVPEGATTGCQLFGPAKDFVVAGRYGYFSGAVLEVLDLAAPAGGERRNGLEFKTPTCGLATDGRSLFVGLQWEGVVVMDLADPEKPSQVGFVSVPGYAVPSEMELRDGFLLAADYSDSKGGLQIVDVRKPSAPDTVATLDLPGRECALATAGDYTCVGTQGPDALHLVDVSTPAAPRAVGRCDLPYTPYALAVAGRYCYVVGEGDFLVIDLSPDASGSMQPAGQLRLWGSDTQLVEATVRGAEAGPAAPSGVALTGEPSAPPLEPSRPQRSPLAALLSVPDEGATGPQAGPERPIIDGQTDEAFWRQFPPRVRTCGVLTQGRAQKAGIRSLAWAAADRGFVYLAVHGQIEGAAPRWAGAQGQPPGPQDDCLLVVVSRPGAEVPPYRFVVGAAVFSLDSSGRPSPAPNVRVGTSWSKGWWDIELAIPWDDLGGLPGKGSPVRATPEGSQLQVTLYRL